MPNRILHLLDPTTPSDAVNSLAHILTLPFQHDIACLGHRSTANLLNLAGIHPAPPARITWLPSHGWADLASSRALKRLLEKIQPTHLHAWGAPALITAALANFSVRCFCTFADIPAHGHLRPLRQIDHRRVGRQTSRQNPPFTAIATSHSIANHLRAADIAADHLRIIPPTIAPAAQLPTIDDLVEQLEIPAADGPIILAGGEGKNARQDLAIWTAAILDQFVPHTRLILREDPRTRALPGLDRFRHSLPNENMLILAARQYSWPALLQLADFFLISATGPIPTGSILEAMNARVPIVATPIPAVTEILTHNQTALIAKHTGIGIAPPTGQNTIRPKALTARIEELLAHPVRAQSLAANAATNFQSRFSPAQTLAAYQAVYNA